MIEIRDFPLGLNAGYARRILEKENLSFPSWYETERLAVYKQQKSGEGVSQQNSVDLQGLRFHADEREGSNSQQVSLDLEKRQAPPPGGQ